MSNFSVAVIEQFNDMLGKNLAHDLKIHDLFFAEVESGAKTFEIRFNEDRGFKVGDWVILQEINHINELFTGRNIIVEITYVTDFMQRNGFVVFSFKKVEYSDGN